MSMFKKQMEWLSNLEKEFKKTLFEIGFKKTRFRLKYIRQHSWKTEVIYIFYEPYCPIYIIPKYMIVIPDLEAKKDQDFSYDIFVQKSINLIKGRDAEIKIPTFSFFKKRVFKKTVSLIISHLDWFEQFKTPDLCLEFLEKEYKDRKHAPAYTNQKAYFEMLQKLKSLDDFQIPDKIVNHDKYTKVYFGKSKESE